MVSWFTLAEEGIVIATEAGLELPAAGWFIVRFAEDSILSMEILMLSGVAGIWRFVVAASDVVILVIFLQ